MAIINDRIKGMRLKNGFTLLEMAQKLNVKEATMQRYESGEIKNIKHETITTLSKILDCSPSYLMGWTDYPEVPADDLVNKKPLCLEEEARKIYKENNFISIIENLPLKKQSELNKIIGSDFMVITNKDEQILIKKYRALNERGIHTVNTVLDSCLEFNQSSAKDEVG